MPEANYQKSSELPELPPPPSPHSEEHLATQDATPKKRKSVGFAPEPEQDLKDHHKYLEERRKEKRSANLFGKIPPELSYLQPRKEGCKPLPQLPRAVKPPRKTKTKRLEDMKDLPTRAVKEISVVNKNTALNFFYHEINIPVGNDRILVDVKYASLTSFDTAKLSKYLINMTNTRVGLGYDYVGEIVGVGANFSDDPDYKIGTLVFGVTNPYERKGALQTLVIINPRDTIVPISAEQLAAMEKINIKLSFSQKLSFLVAEAEADAGDSASSSSSSDLFLSDTDQQKAPVAASSKLTKDPFKLEEELPPLARFCVFSAAFCRARQSLDLVDAIFKKQGYANILINGADTGLGYTLMQILCSSLYADVLQAFNVVLVVLECNVASTKALVAGLGSGGLRNFHVVSFDMENTDLVLRGEKTPVNYKKVPYFASEVLECLFAAIPTSEPIAKANINRAKLDLFVDIVGSKKMFQKAFDIRVLNEGNFPFKARMAPGVEVSSLFGSSSEPLFTRILKPKSMGSCFVSYCKFTVSEPSYLIEKLVDYNGKSMFDPWLMKWTSDLANLLVTKYNYYEKWDLEVKPGWVDQALKLALNGELKMKVDEYVDWRSNFRKYIDQIKSLDGQVVFRVETF